ncbi:MAG: type II toxin-antitoxin system Phd/YefM family antitoxin [Xenococcus sp. (in: cyanobacteria)]
MKTIDINQALPQISKLIEKAVGGEEIIITKNNFLYIYSAIASPVGWVEQINTFEKTYRFNILY